MYVPSHWGCLIFEVSSRSSPHLKNDGEYTGTALSSLVSQLFLGVETLTLSLFGRIPDHGMYTLRDISLFFPDKMRKTANQNEMGLHKSGHKPPQAQFFLQSEIGIIVFILFFPLVHSGIAEKI